MFAPRYFAPRYFAGHYFPAGAPPATGPLNTRAKRASSLLDACGMPFPGGLGTAKRGWCLGFYVGLLPPTSGGGSPLILGRITGHTYGDLLAGAVYGDRLTGRTFGDPMSGEIGGEDG